MKLSKMIALAGMLLATQTARAVSFSSFGLLIDDAGTAVDSKVWSTTSGACKQVDAYQYSCDPGTYYSLKNKNAMGSATVVVDRGSSGTDSIATRFGDPTNKTTNVWVASEIVSSKGIVKCLTTSQVTLGSHCVVASSDQCKWAQQRLSRTNKESFMAAGPAFFASAPSVYDGKLDALQNRMKTVFKDLAQTPTISLPKATPFEVVDLCENFFRQNGAQEMQFGKTSPSSSAKPAAIQ